jgi:hypothetical protein
VTLVLVKMILAHDKKIVILSRTNVAVRMIVAVRIIVDAKTIMMIVPAAMMMSVVVMTTVVGVVTAIPPPTSTPHVRYVTFMGILLVTAGGAMAMIMATMEVTKVPMLLPMV